MAEVSFKKEVET